MNVKYTCPFGSECEEIKDNQLFRCRWFAELQGRNPQTNVEEIRKGCAVEFIPLLLVENIGTSRSVASAAEDLRNKILTSTNILNTAFIEATNRQKQLKG